MTLTMFNKMYQWYKDDFDLELLLRARGMTYQQAYEESQKEKEWF